MLHFFMYIHRYISQTVIIIQNFNVTAKRNGASIMARHAPIAMATYFPPPCIQDEGDACQNSVVLQNAHNYLAENVNYCFSHC